jgi:hypothetical protein
MLHDKVLEQVLRKFQHPNLYWASPIQFTTSQIIFQDPFYYTTPIFWASQMVSYLKKFRTNFVRMVYLTMSRNSSVGIATVYRLDNRMIRVRLPEETGNFSLRHRWDQTGSGTHPASDCVPAVLYLGGKRPGRETDHSPPSRAEVKECVELYLHSSNTPSWRGN